MAKKKARQRRQKKQEEAVRADESRDRDPPAPWIDRRTGLWIITTVSVVLGLFIGAQVMPVSGFRTAVVWSLAAGLSIWLAFGFMLTVTRRLR